MENASGLITYSNFSGARASYEYFRLHTNRELAETYCIDDDSVDIPLDFRFDAPGRPTLLHLLSSHVQYINKLRKCLKEARFLDLEMRSFPHGITAFTLSIFANNPLAASALIDMGCEITDDDFRHAVCYAQDVCSMILATGYDWFKSTFFVSAIVTHMTWKYVQNQRHVFLETDEWREFRKREHARIVLKNKSRINFNRTFVKAHSRRTNKLISLLPRELIPEIEKYF